MGIFRGQGATEYLVLLAVVLIVALVSVALLGFFPGMASDARITQSQSYWRGQARPFAILDAKMDAGLATGSLSVQNMEATGPYTITEMKIGSTTNLTGLTGTNAVFGAGQVQTIAFTASGSTCGSAGTVYDYNVTITYNSPSLTGLKQYGTKNLVGKCT
ncbi:MAG: hypothetical protein WC861_01330 [Candidatus Micrarchaeia archaeon]